MTTPSDKDAIAANNPWTALLVAALLVAAAIVFGFLWLSNGDSVPAATETSAPHQSSPTTASQAQPSPAETTAPSVNEVDDGLMICPASPSTRSRASLLSAAQSRPVIHLPKEPHHVQLGSLHC